MNTIQGEDIDGHRIADCLIVRTGALANKLVANNTLTRSYAYIRKPESAIER